MTVATSSERGGIGGHQYGKYSVKIYTIDGVLVYQAENGGDNTNKSPLGGILSQSSPSSSMIATIANPITFYGNWGAVINQEEHSRDLYNYYWTSYSRGTDGKGAYPTREPQWHNAYLDGYIPLRVKSIYDPCPYLYRIPSNGTWNQFTSNTGWTPWFSYLGGLSWNITTLGESWTSGLGLREPILCSFEFTGGYGWCSSSTVSDKTNVYTLLYEASNWIVLNHNYARSHGMSVRCIEVTRRYAHTFCQQKVCKKRLNVTFVAPKGISMQQMRAARR